MGFKWIVKSSIGDVPNYRMIQESFQYVSILNTLSALSSDEKFRKMYVDYNINKHKYETGSLIDFCCGSRYKESNIFESPVSIQIQLGIDDFEPCCAIKSKDKLHKMTGIYFQIRNIPNQYRSRLNNIYLVALCKTENMDKDTDQFDYIANFIVNELKLLETEGIQIENGSILKGSLIQILADNLGADTISGFTKSFNAQYSCRFCISDSNDRRNLSIECPDKTRTELIKF